MNQTPIGKDIKVLQEEYPFFEYKKFEVADHPDHLEVQYSFSLAGKIGFNPSFKLIKNQFYLKDADIRSASFSNILFHIGLVEMISYWKSACPREIHIYPYLLSDEQSEWLKDLFHNGLGEFFYLNHIQVDRKGFVSFKFFSAESLTKENFESTAEGTIVPVGGGKDSAVTLELIKKKNQPLIPFVLNPLPSALNCIGAAGVGEPVIIERKIDPVLIELNAQGFLNGHTPFSALLSFYTLLVSKVTGIRNVALSNESSANEPTIIGTNINHQYSKTFDYEKTFREYTQKFIGDGFNYFSFLRPLNEMRIAQIFSRHPIYHSVFRSCNAGSKTGIWCCNCSKCLFTYIILSPYLEKEQLKNIFGNDLFENESLLEIFRQLTGNTDEKPFDCVGTIDEVNESIRFALKKYKESSLPFLLKYYLDQNYQIKQIESGKDFYDVRNFLESPYKEILENEIGNL